MHYKLIMQLHKAFQYLKYIAQSTKNIYIDKQFIDIHVFPESGTLYISQETCKRILYQISTCISIYSEHVKSPVMLYLYFVHKTEL